MAVGRQGRAQISSEGATLWGLPAAWGRRATPDAGEVEGASGGWDTWGSRRLRGIAHLCLLSLQLEFHPVLLATRRAVHPEH
jgi:hypothetical protein